MENINRTKYSGQEDIVLFGYQWSLDPGYEDLLMFDGLY